VAALGALLSIHDVTPAHWGAAVRLWRRCRAVGATPALLVVPEWHGAWPLERHRPFVDWLRERAAEGADILLHGLRHDEHGSWRSWRDHLRAAGRTDAEGEFLTLPRAAVRVRVSEGLARLRALGLDPIGFVPPAWLMRGEALDAIAAEGLPLTEDAHRIYLLRGGRPMLGARVHPLRAPAWRWSGRTAVRAWTSAAVAAARALSLPDETPPAATATPLRVGLRVALHPADLEHDATRRSVDRTLARVADRARWIPYRALLPTAT
jgi:hypothetical protein